MSNIALSGLPATQLLVFLDFRSQAASEPFGTEIVHIAVSVKSSADMKSRLRLAVSDELRAVSISRDYIVVCSWRLRAPNRVNCTGETVAIAIIVIITGQCVVTGNCWGIGQKHGYRQKNNTKKNH